MKIVSVPTGRNVLSDRRTVRVAVHVSFSSYRQECPFRQCCHQKRDGCCVSVPTGRNVLSDGICSILFYLFSFSSYRQECPFRLLIKNRGEN